MQYPMDAVTRIFILASPGHYRDSLVALLRTIPHADLVLPDSYSSDIESLYRVDHSTREISSIVLVDLDSALALSIGDKGIAASLARIKSNCPSTKVITLVDNLHHATEAQRLGADCVLPRSISAGEFLGTVQELNSPHRRVTWPQPALSLSSFVDRLGSGLAGR